MCPPSHLPPPPQRQPPPPPPRQPPPPRHSPPPPPPQRQPSPQPPQRQPSPQHHQPSPQQAPPRQPSPQAPPRQPSPQPPPPSRKPSPQQPPQRQPSPPPPPPPPPQPQQPPLHPPQEPPPYPHPPPTYPPQQELLPPPYHPYNYHHQRPKKSASTLASCFLATSFLIFLTIAGIITCFILFRPQSPQISVHSMKFPSFSLLNGTANFTFFQYVAVRNPNRYVFSHYDSSLQLFSSSSGPLGFMYIPAGHIAAGRTQFMSATFNVKSFQLPPNVGLPNGPGSGPAPTMELETKMKLVGSVKVLKVFAHHVEKGAKCRVTIQVSDGAVLGYNC